MWSHRALFSFHVNGESTNYFPLHKIIVSIYHDMIVKTLSIQFNTLLVLYLVLHNRSHVLQILIFFGVLAQNN